MTEIQPNGCELFFSIQEGCRGAWWELFLHAMLDRHCTGTIGWYWGKRPHGVILSTIHNRSHQKFLSRRGLLQWLCCVMFGGLWWTKCWYWPGRDKRGGLSGVCFFERVFQWWLWGWEMSEYVLCEVQLWISLREVILKKRLLPFGNFPKWGGAPTRIQKFWGSFFLAFFWTFLIEGGGGWKH